MKDLKHILRDVPDDAILNFVILRDLYESPDAFDEKIKNDLDERLNFMMDTDLEGDCDLVDLTAYLGSMNIVGLKKK